MTTTTPQSAVSGATTTLRLGTRRSALAVTQSRMVARGIEAASALTGRPVRVELVEVTTAGDVSRAPLTSFGGVGVFVSALREALLSGAVDLAVHSLKDLPTAPAAGLALAAVPAREDPSDALVARDGLTLDALPPGARVGTGSPRRASQLRALRPDLHVVDIRGNVDTRLGLVADGRLDAVLLALSGLRRLGRAEQVSEIIDPSRMLPAPGQGALAVECREDDGAVLAALAPLHDLRTHAAVTAERALLAALEAGCAAPLGALAEVVAPAGPQVLQLRCVVGAVDGSVQLRRAAAAPLGGDPAALGRQLAAELIGAGAAELVAAAPRAPAGDPPDGWRGPGTPDSQNISRAGEGDQ